MAATQPFARGIREVLDGLRDDDRSHNHLNRAAFAIDQMGRHLHGIGYARDHEIAGCLTAAVHALGDSHELPETQRSAAVEQAILHLGQALAHAEEGGITAEP